VLAIAMHPTGRYLASSTLNGEISFWDTQEAVLMGVIEVQFGALYHWLKPCSKFNIVLMHFNDFSVPFV
jgi:hypothetical protein